MNEQPVVEKEAIHDGITEISQSKMLLQKWKYPMGCIP